MAVVMRSREGRLRAELEYEGAADPDGPGVNHIERPAGVPLCGSEPSDFGDGGLDCPACNDLLTLASELEGSE